MKLVSKSIKLGFAFLCIAAVSCTNLKDIERAEASVDRFNADFNAGHFESICLAASSEFLASISRADCAELFNGLQRKLGKVKHASRTKWRVSATLKDTFVILNYHFVFFKGSGDVEFVFVERDGTDLLHNFQINSPELENSLNGLHH